VLLCSGMYGRLGARHKAQRTRQYAQVRGMYRYVRMYLACTGMYRYAQVRTGMYRYAQVRGMRNEAYITKVRKGTRYVQVCSGMYVLLLLNLRLRSRVVVGSGMFRIFFLLNLQLKSRVVVGSGMYYREQHTMAQENKGTEAQRHKAQQHNSPCTVSMHR
jgi:hypothetical protein